MDRTLANQVRQRAEWVCEYCRMAQAFDPITFPIDHIISRQHGGRTVSENLALSCFDCNTYKGPNIAGIDPVGAALTRLFHPRSDAWNDHFEWKGAMVVGKTAVGRTTIEVLSINRIERVATRAALIAEGVFP